MRDFNCCTLTMFDVWLCVRLNNSVALLITLFQVFFFCFRSTQFLLFVFPLLISMHKQNIHFQPLLIFIIVFVSSSQFKTYFTFQIMRRWCGHIKCHAYFLLLVCFYISIKHAEPLFGSHSLAPSRLWPFRNQQSSKATNPKVCIDAQTIREHCCMQLLKAFVRCGCSETSPKANFARLTAHNWPTFK